MCETKAINEEKKEMRTAAVGYLSPLRLNVIHAGRLRDGLWCDNKSERGKISNLPRRRRALTIGKATIHIPSLWNKRG